MEINSNLFSSCMVCLGYFSGMNPTNYLSIIHVMDGFWREMITAHVRDENPTQLSGDYFIKHYENPY